MKTFLYIFLFLFAIVAMPTIAHPDDDDDETEEAVDSTTIQKSILLMPNAFSPNGDGVNDIYRPKQYQNIVEFKAMIFNRWGQCLYSWTDIEGSWDGTYKGKPVKDGVYFVRVKAKGGDGQEFDIKKDVNLLRKFNEVTGANEQ
ncbi:MAG: gliding motility-associated C-terminal domain-containing protein [Prevotella sp.]|nr:gliding motility-associated C-terminal domain-containing protein [Prevotella sp.]MBR1545558.1 gliding motility-associated C-terminal domain-containing protein [Prevotella sp.]